MAQAALEGQEDHPLELHRRPEHLADQEGQGDLAAPVDLVVRPVCFFAITTLEKYSGI